MSAGWSWSRYQRPSALGTVWLAQHGERCVIVSRRMSECAEHVDALCRKCAMWTAFDTDHPGVVANGATRKAALQDLLVETANRKEERE